MKKLIIAVVALLLVATPASAIVYRKGVEVQDQNWTIDNNSNNPVRIYKIKDGKNECYVAKNEFQSVSISCVK